MRCRRERPRERLLGFAAGAAGRLRTGAAGPPALLLGLGHCLQPGVGLLGLGGRATRSRCLPPRRALPAPALPPPVLKEPEPGGAATPEVLLGAESTSSCSWNWGRRGGGLVTTGGLVLVGMAPAMLLMEPGEEDAVHRVGWVRKKDEAACWEAGPVNLTKIWLLMPEE